MGFKSRIGRPIIRKTAANFYLQRKPEEEEEVDAEDSDVKIADYLTPDDQVPNEKNSG